MFQPGAGELPAVNCQARESRQFLQEQQAVVRSMMLLGHQDTTDAVIELHKTNRAYSMREVLAKQVCQPLGSGDQSADESYR